MTKKIITLGLALVLVFQVAVLAGEYLFAVYPLWTGKEVRLQTVPVDPRSLFRGNYAQLRYGISTIEAKDLLKDRPLRNGEIVYVRLRPDADGLFAFSGAQLEKPENGAFIRGRIQRKHSRKKRITYDVNYGIEAYFAPKEKALALEKNLRNGGVAVIMVAKNGKATLKAVIANPETGGFRQGEGRSAAARQFDRTPPPAAQGS